MMEMEEEEEEGGGGGEGWGEKEGGGRRGRRGRNINNKREISCTIYFLIPTNLNRAFMSTIMDRLWLL